MTMIANGASATMNLKAGYTFNSNGVGTIVFGPGPMNGQPQGLQGTEKIGPFPADLICYLTSIQGLDFWVLPPSGEAAITMISGMVGAVQLTEGRALVVNLNVTGAGTWLMVDANGVTNNPVSLSDGMQIGPFSGTKKILITCTAGSIDANVVNSVISVGHVAISPLHSNLSGNVPYLAANSATETGSVGTWHNTIEVAGDVQYVQPIILVTRDPSDGTKTLDDVYTSIAIAPTASLLDANGQPNPTGGNGAWVTASNVTFARQAGASTIAPTPVLGPIIPVQTIPRTDGGNGRLLMCRSYTTQNAASCQPTYTVFATDQALWDSNYPLVGMHKFYYRGGADYASGNQSNFSTIGTPATYWQYANIIGLKCMFTKPHLSIMVVGDSIPAGAYAETGQPVGFGAIARAVENLRALGYNIDITQCAISGAPWDKFLAVGTKYLGILKPDIVICLSWSPNGTSAGTNQGNTLNDAIAHWTQFLTFRDTCIAAGVKGFIGFTPPPAGASGSPSNPIPRVYIRNWLMSSGITYVDNFKMANADYSYKSAYTNDGAYTHPNAAGNALMAADVQTAILSFNLF